MEIFPYKLDLYFWMEVEVFKQQSDKKVIQQRVNDIYAKVALNFASH